MGKLRDWWPSDEMLERSRSSNSAATSGQNAAAGNAGSDTARVSSNSRSPYSQPHVDPMSMGSSPSTLPSSSAAATLRLSEVAAALNAMPTGHPSSLTSPPNEPSSAASSPSTFPQFSLSRPVIKLANTQDHKEELLKKLLSRSESSSDLQMGLQNSVRTTPPGPTSPQSPAAGQQKTNVTGVDMRTSNSPVNHLKESGRTVMNVEDSSDARKRKRDTALSLKRSIISSQDLQERQLPAPPVELEDNPKDSLSRREIHIFSERQRRKGMTHLYAILHSLLPDAKPKTDRCTVLTEAMEYIHELQTRLDELGRQKGEIMALMGEQLNVDSSAGSGSLVQGGADGAESGFRMGNMGLDDLISEEMREEILAAADVVVRFCGRDAFITLNSPKRNGVWSAILQVLHQHDLELLNVTLSTSNDMDYHCIHAKVVNSELHSQELQKMLQDVVLNHAILD